MLSRNSIINDIGRKIIHIITGITLLILIYFDIIGLYFLTFISIISVILSLIYKKYKIPFLTIFIENFDEKNKVNFPGKGFIFFFIGVLFSVILFSKPIALASIAVLTIGDPLSYIIGKYTGKIKIPWNKKKNIEGPFIGACLSTAFIYILYSFKLVYVNKYLLAFLSAFIAILIDLRIGDWEIDDNLTIPLISGLIFTFIATI